MTYHYEADHVRNKARGAWVEILGRLAPQLGEALDRAPRHVDCPFPWHGGKKDFRLFQDAAETGGGICTCCTCHDGFELLMKINGWEFKDALKEVGDLIGAEKVEHGRSSRKKAMRSGVETTAEDLGNPIRSIRGVLVRSGVAPYRFDEKNSDSFFVEVELENGAMQTHWGVGLEPALDAVKAKDGNELILHYHGKKAVTVVEQPTRKGQKAIEKKVHKNIWRCVNLSAPADEAVEGNVAEEAQATDEPVVEKPKAVKSTAAQPEADWMKQAKEKAAKRKEQRARNGARIKKQHADTWDQCLGIESKMAAPVHRYFHGRGINMTLTRSNYLTSENVRFSVSLPYYEENEEKKYEKVGSFPALVCAVRSPDGEILTLHRTFLTNEGQKADVENARKMMPSPHDVSLGGAAIRLGEPLNGYLGVAEGVETALSATQGLGIPCWSTVNAALLTQFEPPKDVHTVVVFADKDRSGTGEIAAEQLKARLESQGIKVLVLLPPQAIPENAKSIDWNDVLKVHGLLGFPSRRFFDRQIKSA